MLRAVIAIHITRVGPFLNCTSSSDVRVYLLHVYIIDIISKGQTKIAVGLLITRILESKHFCKHGFIQKSGHIS